MTVKRYSASIEREVGNIRAHLRKVVKASGVTRREIVQRTDLTFTILANVLRDGGSGFSVSRVLTILGAIDVPPEKFFTELYEFSIADLERQLEQLDTRVQSLTMALVRHGVVTRKQIRAVAEQDRRRRQGRLKTVS